MITLIPTGRGIGGFAYPCYNAQGSQLLQGQPVMRRYPLSYAGGVGHPVGAAGLGEFAGILTSDLNANGHGDIASARMVFEGEVRATVYVHATPASYIVGAQLMPFWDSTNGAYLKQVDFQTGITLLENWTAKTASTLYSARTGVGAYVEIAPQANVRNGLLHYAWPGLLTKDVDYYKAALATSNAAVTTLLAASMLNSAKPDYARNVTILPGGTTADVPAGDVTITGYDIYGTLITDTITFAANATAEGATTKAFASLVSVVFPIQDTTGLATYDIGFGNVLGLGRPFGAKPCVVQARANGTVEGTAPTTVNDLDELAKNTISFNTAANNTLREAWMDAA